MDLSQVVLTVKKSNETREGEQLMLVRIINKHSRCVEEVTVRRVSELDSLSDYLSSYYGGCIIPVPLPNTTYF